MSTKVKVLFETSFCLLLAFSLRLVYLAKIASLSELVIDCGFLFKFDYAEVSSKLPFS